MQIPANAEVHYHFPVIIELRSVEKEVRPRQLDGITGSLSEELKYVGR